MGKISVRKKNKIYLIRNRLVFPENVNDRVLREISPGNAYEGLLPVEKRRHRRKTELISEAADLIPLTELFSSSITKDLFLKTACQIGRILCICEERLNPYNLELHRDRIFADPFRKTVRCIYWPLVNGQQDRPPARFLRELPYGLPFAPDEDPSYLDRYQDFFREQKPFSGADFVRMVLFLMGKESAEEPGVPGKIQGEGFSFAERLPESGRTPGAYSVSAPADRRIGYDPRETHAKTPRSLEDTISLHSVDPSIREMIPGSSEAGPARMQAARILRLKTGEFRIAEGSGLIIGTAPGDCGFRITGNGSISRIHAGISFRGGKYYLSDLGSEMRGSLNGSYVSGRRLMPGKEQELYDGCIFRLADEDFSFRLVRRGC